MADKVQDGGCFSRYMRDDLREYCIYRLAPAPLALVC
jgi:hypothetical protein